MFAQCKANSKGHPHEGRLLQRQLIFLFYFFQKYCSHQNCWYYFFVVFCLYCNPASQISSFLKFFCFASLGFFCSSDLHVALCSSSVKSYFHFLFPLNQHRQSSFPQPCFKLTHLSVKLFINSKGEKQGKTPSSVLPCTYDQVTIPYLIFKNPPGTGEILWTSSAFSRCQVKPHQSPLTISTIKDLSDN